MVCWTYSEVGVPRFRAADWLIVVFERGAWQGQRLLHGASERGDVASADLFLSLLPPPAPSLSAVITSMGVLF